MKNLNFLFLITIVSLLFSCSITNHQKKGTVIPENFNYETDFITIKTAMILPFEIDGASKNFLFDTGADFSIIQRDSILGKTIDVGGATKRSQKMGEEYVKSLKIGEVDFFNTFAVNGDLPGLKEQIPNFGGLIGQSVIQKANWLIDYTNKRLRVSNENLVDETFTTLNIKIEGGRPYTFLLINGQLHKVLIDFGSTSELTLPKEYFLSEELLEIYKFQDNNRERYSIGGLQTIEEKVGNIPEVKIGDLIFENVTATINESSKPRIGISFFKDCIIYIDNINDIYQVKK